VSCLALLVATSPRAAQNQAGGDGVFVTVDEATSALADGRTRRLYTTTGFVLSDEGNPFHRAEQDCSGAEIVAADGKSRSGAGSCVAIDPDGDVWWIWWRGDAKGGTWGFLGGTGKFEGITGGGSLRYALAWPDGRFTLKWEGTWERP
jgi:hypothetical protein